MILMILDPEVSDFLEHFGVKGQKWGVVKKEPLAGGDSTKKESVRSRIGARNLKTNTERQNTLKARAAKGDIRITELNAEIAALPKSAIYKKGSLTYERDVSIKQRDADLKKASKTPTSGLTSTQKKVLIGAGVATVLVGFYVVSKHTDPEGIGAAIRRGQSQREHGDIFKPNPILAGNMSPSQIREQVSKQVNPKYSRPGGQMNCRRATFAHELRRRGYDVQATTSPMGYGQNESGLVNALVKGDKNRLSWQSMSAYNDSPLGVRTRAAVDDTRTHTAFTESVSKVSGLRTALSKHPVGARGEAVFNEYGFAHSMHWEMFKDGPHIFDSQKATHYPVTDEGLKKLTDKWGVPNVMEITRLDNVDLDLKFLSRWATNTGDSS